MPGGGGDHSSRKATFAARQREQAVVELALRGATFEQIGRQLNIDPSTAYKAWVRAMKRLPKGDIEAMRTAQGERLQRMRGKVWGEIAGRPDPNDPGKGIPPAPELLNDLIGTALKIEARTAALYGLDAPTKQQIVATAVVGAPLSEEELDRRLDRLTEEERHDYVRLSIKMEGRGADAEPQPAESDAALSHPKLEEPPKR